MLRGLIKKIKGMHERHKESRILMARLAKSEAAAYVATKIIHSLHFASGCESADWRTEQIDVEGCAFWCCSDCSGTMVGPSREKMADWDMHPYEVDLYFPGCMYPQSLCNPHEPEGIEACRDINLLLRTLEERALELA